VSVERIRQLRHAVSQSFVDTLRASGSEPSELELSSAWHTRLHRQPDLTDEGWYMPPPHGIILAIGNERMNRPSFRPAETWPDDEHRLHPESLVFAYASPVQRNSGLIGDLACSLYGGTDSHVRDHLRNVWNVTHQIIESARPDMTFAELYIESQQLVAAAGLTNMVESLHGGSTTDIGHSIPWFIDPPTASEQATLTTGTAQEIADLVSSKRIFVYDSNHRTIGAHAAFTVEPRLVAPGMPMAGFHIVVAFEDGDKHVITEFDPLFDYFEMDWLS
jgi:hypothetical protein